MQFAFRDRAVLQQFFRARGLSYFILAFGYGEGSVFPEAIIRKFDLHPKWVIVGADPFFGTPPSAAASRAMSFGYLEAWKSRFEAGSSLAVQRLIYQMFPYVALSQFDVHPQWIDYRAKSDGTLRLAAWRGMPGAISPEDTARTAPSLDAVEDAKAFRTELDARGGRLVLTWIPPSSGSIGQTSRVGTSGSINCPGGDRVGHNRWQPSGRRKLPAAQFVSSGCLWQNYRARAESVQGNERDVSGHHRTPEESLSGLPGTSSLWAARRDRSR